MLFQQYIESCSPSIFDGLAQLISQDMSFLIRHEFGCYVVQRVLQRSSEDIIGLEKMCKENFIELSFNEYSSRVLQIMIKKDKEFRKFAFESLKDKLGICSDSISVVFLIAVAIENSENACEYAHIKRNILEKMDQIIHSKFLKRLVVVLIENLPMQDLDQMFDTLALGQNFLDYFTEKYYTYIVIAFLNRQHTRTVHLVQSLVHFRLNDLLKTKYFKFMILTLLDSGIPESIATLNKILLGIPSVELNRMSRKDPEYFVFCAYITLTSFDKRNLKNLSIYLAQVENIFSLRTDNRKKYSAFLLDFAQRNHGRIEAPIKSHWFQQRDSDLFQDLQSRSALN